MQISAMMRQVDRRGGKPGCGVCSVPLINWSCFWADRAMTRCSQLAGSGSGVLGMI